MIAIAVDDEQLALNNLEITLGEIPQITEAVVFISAEKVLDWLSKRTADVAFLDINMAQMDGLTLAKRLKELCPQCAVIFVTGYSEYAVQAFRLHASGYLLKPVSVDAVNEEIEHLLNSTAWMGRNSSRMYVRCFGNFEVFFDGEPIRFKYNKTKELLAYLVDRRGAFCDIGTLCAILWEDKEDSVGLKSQLRHLIADLAAALRKTGNNDILIKRRGAVAVLSEQLECDYYDWMKGDITAINSYAGEYMTQYSWAEMTTGALIHSQKI